MNGRLDAAAPAAATAGRAPLVSASPQPPRAEPASQAALGRNAGTTGTGIGTSGGAGTGLGSSTGTAGGNLGSGGAAGAAGATPPAVGGSEYDLVGALFNGNAQAFTQAVLASGLWVEKVDEDALVEARGSGMRRVQCRPRPEPADLPAPTPPPQAPRPRQSPSPACSTFRTQRPSRRCGRRWRGLSRGRARWPRRQPGCARRWQLGPLPASAHFRHASHLAPAAPDAMLLHRAGRSWPVGTQRLGRTLPPQRSLAAVSWRRRRRAGWRVPRLSAAARWPATWQVRARPLL